MESKESLPQFAGMVDSDATGDTNTGSIERHPNEVAESETETSQGQEAERSSLENEHLIDPLSSIVLFHDDKHKEAYAFVNGETMALKSKRFRHWLRVHLYRSGIKTTNNNLKEVIGGLESKAICESPEKALYNRIARVDGALWYDLGNGKAVRITAEGWAVEDAPVLFVRYPHQQSQVIPVSGGDPNKVFKFINVPDEYRLLTLVYLITCFVDDIPHPICHPYGPQGAGKTTYFKVLKRLCDPSSAETLITPKDQTELIRYIARHHLCLFDNMSDLPSRMSDILAQACTGGAYSMRQLFTDDDDVIFRVKKCIGINGINLLISKPDLMDRSILISLERIDPSCRFDEATLWKEFEKDKPEILGGIFDVLSKAIAIYPSVKLSTLPRMADFAKWGYAIAEALGAGGAKFLQAYETNIQKQGEEVIEGNTLAQAVLTFMAQRDSWTGTVKIAWLSLKELADPDKADPTFPKAERMLHAYLDRIKANLIDQGIAYSVGKREGRGMPLTFKKETQINSFASFPSEADSATTIAEANDMTEPIPIIEPPMPRRRERIRRRDEANVAPAAKLPGCND